MVASDSNGLFGQRDAAEATRIEEPQCPWCGYLLVGLEVDRCPECGTVGAVSAAERGVPVLALRRTKRRCVHGIVAATAIAGVIDSFQPVLELGGYAILIATYWATLTWCSADSRERGSRYFMGEKLLVVFVPPLGLLWYLLTRRRFNALA